MNRNMHNIHTFASSGLSLRERQILHYMASGYNNQSIAEDLCLAMGTVKNYVSSIYLKLHVQTRAEAVAWAWKTGMHTISEEYDSRHITK